MKNKKTILIILAMIAAVLLCGCSSEYRDDVPTTELSAIIESSINPDNTMLELPDGFIAGSMNMETSDFKEHIAKVNGSSTSIDEYGIFKAVDETQCQNIAASVDEYLRFRVDTWMEGYIPEEFPKVENAEYKVYGNYIVYLILDEDAKDAIFTDIEKALK